MGSDGGSPDRVSRRDRYRDDDENDRDRDRPSRRDDRDSDRPRPNRDRDSDRRKSRSRSRSGSESRQPRRRERERRRSRTPGSPRRRRSRSRERRRDRDPDRDGGRRRRRDRDEDRDSHRGRRSTEGKELDTRRRRRDIDVDDDDKPSGKPDRAARRASPLRRQGPLPSQGDSFAVASGDLDEPPKPKEKPNFGNSGALAAASNSVQQADGTSITLKYHEPAEARKPPAKDDWRLFVFKGEDVLDTIPLSARSCWLVGREAAVVDMNAEHPSISKQHAVIQFRYIEKRNEFGDRMGRVRPYLIDLESANGTIMNGNKVGESRYVELRDKDVIKFGHSTREYVLMLAPKA